MNANCMSSVILQYTVFFKVKIILGDKNFLAFSIWVGLLLNFRKIEPTISYNRFLVKNACTDGLYRTGD